MECLFATTKGCTRNILRCPDRWRSQRFGWMVRAHGTDKTSSSVSDPVRSSAVAPSVRAGLVSIRDGAEGVLRDLNHASALVDGIVESTLLEL
jgi:hypothetical protein